MGSNRDVHMRVKVVVPPRQLCWHFLFFSVSEASRPIRNAWHRVSDHQSTSLVLHTLINGTAFSLDIISSYLTTHSFSDLSVVILLTAITPNLICSSKQTCSSYIQNTRTRSAYYWFTPDLKKTWTTQTRQTAFWTYLASFSLNLSENLKNLRSATNNVDRSPSSKLKNV